MAFESLSAKEQEIVLLCMKATAAYVDDWEKHTRLGLEPEELQRVIIEWPNIDDADENGNGFLAINNCLNEVCHGFPVALDHWNEWFDAPKPEVEPVYQKWLSLRRTLGGVR